MIAQGSRAAKAAWLTVTAVGLTALLAGCDVGETFGGFGWPRGITRQSERMYDIWIGSTVAALAVGFFVWGLIFWCIFRYRRSSDEMPAQTRYNMPLEVLYTVIPFLVVAVLFFYTAIVQTDVNKLSSNPDVRIEVVGFKWNWQFVYTGQKGPDGQDIVTTGSDDYIPVLVLPTGRSIQFLETSRDVIHSFWVPDMLFKRDVIPGVENRFEVTIERPGPYVGRCAELCGTYHSMMNFEVRAVSPEDYDRYLALRKEGKSTPEALLGIGQKDAFATTTEPFDSDRQRTAG